ncbi:MAG: acyltransferase [Cyanobacteria bacterium J06576_12]
MLKQLYAQAINRFSQTISVESGVQLHPTATLKADSDSHIQLSSQTQVGKHSTLLAYANSKILLGEQVIIGSFNYLNAGPGDIVVEQGVLMAHFVSIIASSHGIDDLSMPIRIQRPSSDHKIGVVVEAGAWLGAHSIVLPGVTIGKGAVVGAGAVVTKDIPSLGIVVGNPARLIRYRGESATATNVAHV